MNMISVWHELTDKDRETVTYKTGFEHGHSGREFSRAYRGNPISEFLYYTGYQNGVSAAKEHDA